MVHGIVQQPLRLVRQLQPAVPDPGAVPRLYPVPCATRLFPWFMLSLLAVFLGMVYRYLRREDWRPVDALGLLLFVRFSTLTFYTYSFPGTRTASTYVLPGDLACLFEETRVWVLLLCVADLQPRADDLSRSVPSLATRCWQAKRLAQTRGLVRTGTGSLFHLSRDRAPCVFSPVEYGGFITRSANLAPDATST